MVTFVGFCEVPGQNSLVTSSVSLLLPGGEPTCPPRGNRSHISPGGCDLLLGSRQRGTQAPGPASTSPGCAFPPRVPCCQSVEKCLIPHGASSADT